MEQTIRILWLSDIHYRNDFEQKEELFVRTQAFIEKVRDYLLEIAHETYDNKLHYFIISGDLGYSGNDSDYTALYEEIISKVEVVFRENKQSPVILCCPGNHDVNRGKSEMYKGFITFIEKYLRTAESPNDLLIHKNVAMELRTEQATQRESLLEEYGVEKAKKIFSSYSDFIKRLHKEKKNDSLKEYKKNNFLFGQISDDDNKIIFTILNSSWFSLGDGFDELIIKFYLEKWTAELKRLEKKYRKKCNTSNSDSSIKEEFNKITERFMTRIAKVKEFCSEYGKQIVGLKFIKESGYLETLKQNPHYTAITFFHHPLSWLEESQKYDYTGTGEKELLTLLKHSDILLTGHEHVNVQITPERLFDKLIHIPGGMFIQDKNQFYKGGQNRFAILELDKENKELTVRNFIWTQNLTDVEKKWEEFKRDEKKWAKLPLKDKVSFFISSSNISEYQSFFIKKFNPFLYLKKYVNPAIDIHPKKLWHISSVKDENGEEKEIFKQISFSHNNDSYLVIVSFVSGITLFKDQVNYLKLFELITSFVNKRKRKISDTHIIFFQLDIISEKESNAVDSYLSNIYTKKITSDEIIRESFDTIQRNSDARFNLFRNKIFTDVEENIKKTSENSKNTVNNFSSYINLKLANFVIPFWKIDNYTY